MQHTGALAQKFFQTPARMADKTIERSVFRGYLITADASRRDWLHALVYETGQATLQVSLDRYPEPSELRQFARQLDPDFVVLDFLYPEAACAIIAMMREKWPRCAWIGVDGGSGVCPATVAFPGHLEDIERALFHAVHALPRASTNSRLYAFVPAKAGCGASTLAWNAAFACARAPQGRVLLVEADLRAGALSFLLKTPPSGSTQSALRAIHTGDEHAVRVAFTNVDRVEMLLSSRAAMDPAPRWDSYFHLLSLVRPRYDVVLVDLPELVNAGSSEVARAADAVFVVTTPELLPLKLAEHRCLDLEQWGVEPKKIRLLLNRAQRSELSARDVEENLHRPVAESFPNDYHAVRKATLNGGPVDADSALGRAFAHFTNTLQPFAAASGASQGGLMSFLNRLR